MQGIVSHADSATAIRPRVLPVVRYPGGKQRLLAFLNEFLPKQDGISGRYMEPFVGGASVFLHLRPRRAILADLTSELIDLYKGIRKAPLSVWKKYRSFGDTKDEYRRVRSMDPSQMELADRAARLLYLNRTCFKGNWRHNAKGEFNIGYGGQSRRWVVTRDYLSAVSRALRYASLRCSDFEPIIENAVEGDYLFLDPPYLPGQKQLVHDHYSWIRFTFSDHERLANALRRCADRGVRWAMTTSGHRDVLALFRGFRVRKIPQRGPRANGSGEVLILAHGGGQ